MGWPVERREMHSVMTAAKELNLSANRLRRILEKGGLVSPSSVNDHAGRIMFPAQPANEFLELFFESLPLRAAARHLGMSINSSLLLLNEQFVQPLVKSTDGRLTQHAYPKRRLDAFLDELTADVTELSVGEKGFTPITKAVRKYRFKETDIVEMLRNRKLRQVRIDPHGHGYNAIHVADDELKRLASTEYYGVSSRDVQKRLRITSSRVRTQ